MGDLLGSIGNVAQGVIIGPDAENLTTTEKVKRGILSLAAASQNPAGLISAQQQFAAMDAPTHALMASPEFQALPPDQQAALLAHSGFKAPNILPPTSAIAQEKYLKATGSVKSITDAKNDYEASLRSDPPEVTQAKLAAYRRAIGQPVTPAMTAAEANAGAGAAGQQPNLEAGAAITGAPSGVTIKGTARTRSMPAGGTMPPPPGTPGAPAGPEGGLTALPTSPAAVDATRTAQGGNPGIHMVKWPDGTVRASKLVQAEDGSLTWNEMSPKEVDASNKQQAALASEAAAQFQKDQAGVKGQLTGAQSIVDTLRPLTHGAFPMLKTPEKPDWGYTLKQYWRFHAPYVTTDNEQQQRFGAFAQHALGLLAHSLGMRPGPLSAAQLAGSLYKPGDSEEQVNKRLDQLANFKQNQLHELFAANGYEDIAPSAAAPVAAPTAPTAAPKLTAEQRATMLKALEAPAKKGRRATPEAP